MDDTKRRAMIKSQAAKNKETGNVDPKGTGLSTPSMKRKLPSKGDCPPKKPKVPLEPVVGLMAEGAKTITPAKHGARKSLMKGRSTSKEKSPILLREDSKYVLERLTSIITSEDYEDLSNHSTEAMGETGLFSIAQVTMSVNLTFRPYFLVRPLIHCCFSSHGHDEGANGTVP